MTASYMCLKEVTVENCVSKRGFAFWEIRLHRAKHHFPKNGVSMYVYSYLTCMLQCSIACICVDALNCVYVCMHIYVSIHISSTCLRPICGILLVYWSKLKCGTNSIELVHMQETEVRKIILPTKRMKNITEISRNEKQLRSKKLNININL